MLGHLHAISLSLPKTPVEVLSQFSMPSDAVRKVYEDLQAAGIAQALVLSTCNRVEIYAVSERESDLVEALKARQTGLSSAFYQYLDRWRGLSAAEHLFRVAAGLESAILGENEIQGQVRRASDESQSFGMGGGVLARTVQAAIRCGKRARAEAPSGPSLCALVSERIDRPWTLVGTGQLARELMDATSIRPSHIVSRDIGRARQLASKIGASASSLESGVDGEVIVWATVAPMPTGFKWDPDRLFIDLAFPSVSNGAERGVLTLREIQDCAKAEANEIRIPAMVRIVEEELAHFRSEASSWPVRETVAMLHQQVREIANSQLEWAEQELGEMTPRQRIVLEAMVARIVNRSLHKPITNLRRLGEDPRYAETIDELFELKPADMQTAEEG